jgi:phosphatidylethanolamine-binding protein (PEBP) family uncharacterized protein
MSSQGFDELRPDMRLTSSAIAVILLSSCGSETTTMVEKLEKPPMTLTSPAFKHGVTLPERYSGPIWEHSHPPSPPLEWSNVPEGTKCFALILYNTEADAVGEYSVYWLVLNLPGDTRFLSEGAGNRGADAGSGLGSYTGIGRAEGRPPRLLFVLYALDTPVNCSFLIRGPGEFEQAAAGHVLAKAELACYPRRVPLTIPKMM